MECVRPRRERRRPDPCTTLSAALRRDTESRDTTSRHRLGATVASLYLKVPEISIESLDESYTGRWSLEVMNTILIAVFGNRDSGIVSTKVISPKTAVVPCRERRREERGMCM